MGDMECGDIAYDWLLSVVNQRRWIIVERDGRYEVCEHAAGSIAPTTSYATPHGAAARLLQLMDIQCAIKPQDWPESIGDQS